MKHFLFFHFPFTLKLSHFLLKRDFFYQRSNLKSNHWWWNSKSQKEFDAIKVYNQMNINVCSTNFFWRYVLASAWYPPIPWNYHDGLSWKRQTSPYLQTVRYFLNHPQNLEYKRYGIPITILKPNFNKFFGKTSKSNYLLQILLSESAIKWYSWE